MQCLLSSCMQRFDNDRTISFIPPDGEFELMSYRLNTQVTCRLLAHFAFFYTRFWPYAPSCCIVVACVLACLCAYVFCKIKKILLFFFLLITLWPLLQLLFLLLLFVVCLIVFVVFYCAFSALRIYLFLINILSFAQVKPLIWIEAAIVSKGSRIEYLVKVRWSHTNFVLKQM